jgi:hypothetical protein
LTVVAVSDIASLWTLACEDAGYRVGADTVLYIVPGAGEGEQAVHLQPGSEVTVVRGWPLAKNQVEDANSAENRDKHRVFVRDFVSCRVALGRLRHELEHGRQYDHSPSVYEAMSFVRDALSREFEVAGAHEVAGAASLYNLLPFEEDANRAAARITSSSFGPPSDAELEATDGPLFRDPTLPDPGTLAPRMLAFAAVFPSGLSWVAQQRSETLPELVARLGPDGPPAWQDLEAEAEIAGFGRAAIAQSPSAQEAAAATIPALAWREVREQIRLGREAAESVLRSHFSDLQLS